MVEPDKISDDDDASLRGIAKTYYWLDAEQERIAGLIVKGHSPHENYKKLDELRARMRQLGRDSRRILDRIAGEK